MDKRLERFKNVSLVILTNIDLYDIINKKDITNE